MKSTRFFSSPSQKHYGAQTSEKNLRVWTSTLANIFTVLDPVKYKEVAKQHLVP